MKYSLIQASKNGGENNRPLKKIKELNAYFLWSLRRPKVKSTKLTNIFIVCSPFERTTDARLEIWECGSLSFIFSDFP